MVDQSNLHDASDDRAAACDPVIPDQRVKSRIFAVIGVGLVVLGAVSVVPRAQIDNPKRHASDFTCYTAASRAILEGGNPYAVTSPRGWHYIYPPLFAMMVTPVAFFHPQVQAAIWLCISALLAFTCYDESVRLLREVLLAEGIAWTDRSPLPLWLRWGPFLSIVLYGISAFELGQVSILVLYLVLLGARLTLTGCGVREWLGGGVALAGAAMLKVMPALVATAIIACLVISPSGARAIERPRQRAALALGGVAGGLLLFLLAIPAAGVGWHANTLNLTRFWHSVILGEDVTTDSRRTYLLSGNQTFTIAARKLGNCVLSGGAIIPTTDDTPVPADAPMQSASAAAAVTTLNVMIAVALLASMVRLARAGGLLHHALVLGLACTAVLLFSPFSWSHGFVLLVPAVLFGPLWLLRAGRSHLALVIAVVPLAFELAHYLLRSTFRMVGGLGVSLALWVAALCVLVLTLPRTTPARQ